MGTYYIAERRAGGLNIKNEIDKPQAIRRIRQGYDVYASRRNAHTLAEALSDGQGSWRDAPHFIGGYGHYHDVSHTYAGHIFYGIER